MYNVRMFKIEHALKLKPDIFNVNFCMFAENGLLLEMLKRNRWTGYTVFDNQEIVYIGVMFMHPKIKNCAIVVGGSNPPHEKYVRGYYNTCKKYFRQCIDDLGVNEVHAYIGIDNLKGLKWAENFGLKFMGEVPRGFESGNYALYRWQK